MSGPVSSAVISEAVSRITSLLTGKYSEHNNVQELIDRLVMACIEIKSAVKESEALKEEFDIDIDEELHEWQEKLKEALCQANEAVSNFPAEILLEEPNQTIEGRHTASNLGEAVTRQVDLEANLPHDPFMQEEGSDDTTLVHTASNLTEAVTRQVDQQANLPHDPLMQEQGSDDATLVRIASKHMKAVTRRLDQQANLPHDPLMQEEGSDDATLVRIASNLMKAVTRRLDQQANLPHDPFKLLRLLINRRFSPVPLWQLLSNLYEKHLRPVKQFLDDLSSPLQEIEWSIAKALKYCLILRIHPCKKWPVEYLENDKNVSKLKNTVEKLEKMAGNIGNFIKLLELQKKRKMSRKRKRSGVALQGFFLVLSLKLQTYALFCYREDPYLLVTMLFRANCTVPTAITGDIFIGFIM